MVAALLCLPAALPAGGSAAVGRVVTVDSLAPALLRDINAVRHSHGLKPLKLSLELSAAASFHSREMALGGFFAHESRDGSAFDKRVARFYPRKKAYGSWAVGENLVYASPDLSAAQAVNLWMHSSGHRENLLSPVWREIGLGAVHALAAPRTFGGLDVTLVTADFGAR